MPYLKWLPLLSLWLISACTAVSPTPTASPATAVAVQPTVTNNPTITHTPSPTIRPTSTRRPTRTPFPTSTPTLTPTPSQTPTSTPDTSTAVIWADDVTVVNEFISYDLNWSPRSEEYVYLSNTQTEDSQQVHWQSVTASNSTLLTPSEMDFDPSTILWHPTGAYFLISDNNFSSPTTRRINQFTQQATLIDTIGFPWGWVNNDVLVTKIRMGTGLNAIRRQNINTGETFSTGFNGSVKAVSRDYPILSEIPSYNGSVAVLMTESLRDIDRHIIEGEYVKRLGSDVGNFIAREFNSTFMDVFTDTNQLLVTTWPLVTSITEEEMIFLREWSADLQLWNPDTDELTLLVSGAFHGRFSPDGKHLLYLLPDEPYPTLTVQTLATEKSRFTLPIHKDNLEQASFSPDGRYIVFFSPQNTANEAEHGRVYLTLYDLETDQFLPQVEAQTRDIFWSPSSKRLLFYDNTNALMRYELSAGTIAPLATTGADRLANPQWSASGRHLSLNIYGCYEKGSRCTVILDLQAP